jgi:hypothetical protein
MALAFARHHDPTVANSLRPLPYLKRWNGAYGPAGLQVIGMHTPEFGFEHLRDNVEGAVRELGIRFPVGQDNGYRTWRAWSNRAWPAFDLLEPSARLSGAGMLGTSPAGANHRVLHAIYRVVTRTRAVTGRPFTRTGL